MLKNFFKNLFSPNNQERKKTKIVVIDDLGTNRMFFQRVLEKRGYTVLTANSGEPVVIIGEQFIEFER